MRFVGIVAWHCYIYHNFILSPYLCVYCFTYVFIVLLFFHFYFDLSLLLFFLTNTNSLSLHARVFGRVCLKFYFYFPYNFNLFSPNRKQMDRDVKSIITKLKLTSSQTPRNRGAFESNEDMSSYQPTFLRRKVKQSSQHSSFLSKENNSQTFELTIDGNQAISPYPTTPSALYQRSLSRSRPTKVHMLSLNQDSSKTLTDTTPRSNHTFLSATPKQMEGGVSFLLPSSIVLLLLVAPAGYGFLLFGLFACSSQNGTNVVFFDPERLADRGGVLQIIVPAQEHAAVALGDAGAIDA